MNWYFWLALALGLSLIIGFLWDWLEEESEEPSVDYTPEELALAEFLEKKQAINDIYLKANAELLRLRKF